MRLAFPIAGTGGAKAAGTDGKKMVYGLLMYGEDLYLELQKWKRRASPWPVDRTAEIYPGGTDLHPEAGEQTGRLGRTERCAQMAGRTEPADHPGIHERPVDRGAGAEVPSVRREHPQDRRKIAPNGEIIITENAAFGPRFYVILLTFFHQSPAAGFRRSDCRTDDSRLY